ncbi:hypothetical protein N7490_003321 [Penicillium lividum]|nr:hypothetical protein N7490_003321 [Penicillium lividum]
MIIYRIIFEQSLILSREEENDRIHTEINLVLKIRLKELAKVRIERQLLKIEHHTYLWLYLAINDIRTTFKSGLWPIENSIILIPPSVNAAYEKILSRVPADNMDLVKKILEIIVVARRPMAIQEMAIALGIATNSEARIIMGSGLDPTHFPEKLRQLCGLFIFINDSKVYLIHETAREFLIQKKVQPISILHTGAA